MRLIFFTLKYLIFMQKLIPALLLTLFTLASCGKSDDDVAAKLATWTVTSYQIPSNNIALKEDKTSLFNGYSFEFNDDHKMVVHMPNGSLADAKWNVDDSNATAAFGMENPASPITDFLGNWNVTENTDTSLKLEGSTDASAGSNFGKVLHFQKL
jgi:hypothetical protein